MRPTSPAYAVSPAGLLLAGADRPAVDQRRRTPNVSGPLAPVMIVIHYTAGGSAASSAAWLCQAKAKASAHLVLARDGLEVRQLAPFKVATWHAGVSRWKGRTNLNRYAVGIELANWGHLSRGIGIQAGSYLAGDRPMHPDAYVIATHKHESQPRAWERYTSAQVDCAAAICAALLARYPAIPEADIVGHDDIAADRKLDPGPAWDWTAFRARLAHHRSLHA